MLAPSANAFLRRSVFDIESPEIPYVARSNAVSISFCSLVLSFLYSLPNIFRARLFLLFVLTDILLDVLYIPVAGAFPFSTAYTSPLHLKRSFIFPLGERADTMFCGLNLMTSSPTTLDVGSCSTLPSRWKSSVSVPSGNTPSPRFVRTPSFIPKSLSILGLLGLNAAPRTPPDKSGIASRTTDFVVAQTLGVSNTNGALMATDPVDPALPGIGVVYPSALTIFNPVLACCAIYHAGFTGATIIAASTIIFAV